MSSRPVPSQAEAYLLAEVRRNGGRLSLHQLRGAAELHLLPTPTRRGLGRGRGVSITYPGGTVEILRAWSLLPRSERGYTSVIALYARCLPVPTDSYRAAQARWYSDFISRHLPDAVNEGVTEGGGLSWDMRRNLGAWLTARWNSTPLNERDDEPEARRGVAAKGTASELVGMLVELVPALLAGTSLVDYSSAAWEELGASLGTLQFDRALTELEVRQGLDAQPAETPQLFEAVNVALRLAGDGGLDGVSDQELDSARDLSSLLLGSLRDVAYLLRYGVSGSGLPPTVVQGLRSGLQPLRGFRFDPVFQGGLMIPMVAGLSRRFPEGVRVLEPKLRESAPLLEANASFIHSLPWSLREKLRRARPTPGGFPARLIPEIQPHFQSWAAANPDFAARLAGTAPSPHPVIPSP